MTNSSINLTAYCALVHRIYITKGIKEFSRAQHKT